MLSRVCLSFFRHVLEKWKSFSQLRGSSSLCEIKFPPSTSLAFVRVAFKSQSLWAKFKSHQNQSTRDVAESERTNERNLSYDLIAAITANYIIPRCMECECSQLTIWFTGIALDSNSTESRWKRRDRHTKVFRTIIKFEFNYLARRYALNVVNFTSL